MGGNSNSKLFEKKFVKSLCHKKPRIFPEFFHAVLQFESNFGIFEFFREFYATIFMNWLNRHKKGSKGVVLTSSKEHSRILSFDVDFSTCHYSQNGRFAKFQQSSVRVKLLRKIRQIVFRQITKFLLNLIWTEILSISENSISSVSVKNTQQNWILGFFFEVFWCCLWVFVPEFESILLHISL